MKHIFALILFVSIMTGCTQSSELEERAFSLRSKLQQNGCAFDAAVTADYGDKQFLFRLQCEAENSGRLKFSVLEPNSISGISGTIGADGGKLTFDDAALSFSLLADGHLSPISAPWIFVNTLLGGYLKSYTVENDLLRLSLDDSYEEGALHLDIWLNADDLPVHGDILYENRRILTIQIENFRFL